MDQHSGSNEARDDDTQPEQSDKASVGGDISQAVNTGGLQKLSDSLKSKHLVGLQCTEWGLLVSCSGNKKLTCFPLFVFNKSSYLSLECRLFCVQNSSSNNK